MKLYLLLTLTLAFLPQACFAQGPLQRKAAAQLAAGKDDGGLQVKDVEGVIWEFKVMENGERDLSRKTKMTGRIRIKQTSVFAVGTVEVVDDGEGQLRDAAELMKEFDKNGDQSLDLDELDRLLASVRGEDRTSERTQNPSDMQGELKNVLSERLRKASEDDIGGERIGDLTKSGAGVNKLKFDEDDDHPLSGIVFVQPDAQRGGVWSGYYDEFSSGKKTKRWYFEMRKIES